MAAPGFIGCRGPPPNPDEENMTKKTNDTAIADYVDFKIEVKQAGAKNRGLQNALNIIEARYARKQKMVENGLLSDDAGKKLMGQKMKDMAAAYADHIIVGWSGEIKGKKLPEFSRDAVIELLTDEDNDALFADLIVFSVEAGNFEAEVQKAEAKNSKKSSSGGDDTGQE
jgi:hypothetical protein